MRHGKNYWTYGRCKKESLKYKTRSEFVKNNKGAYERSRLNGWLDDVCSHMGSGSISRKPSGYWTKDKCIDMALNCSSRKEFAEKYNSAYERSRFNGWLDDVCSHIVKNKKILVTIEHELDGILEKIVLNKCIDKSLLLNMIITDWLIQNNYL